MDIQPDYDAFTNYGAFDSYPHDREMILDFVKKGWLKAFESLEDCRDFLGADPVLNPFAIIEKAKWNSHTGKPDVKYRMIMDAKKSMVKEASNKEFRSLLPRMSDAITSILELLDGLSPEESVALMVLDATDAFWQIPLHHEERRYYCGRVTTETGRQV